MKGEVGKMPDGTFCKQLPAEMPLANLIKPNKLPLQQLGVTTTIGYRFVKLEPRQLMRNQPG
jgi:hypothetical protein